MVAEADLRLQSRLDDFSYQVSAGNDSRFWFRLERRPDRDVITDFSLGSVDKTRAASALLSCYQQLGLVPRLMIVFKDILRPNASRDGSVTTARSLYDAQRLYAACGRAALLSLGALKIDETLERRKGKYDLVLRAATTRLVSR